PVGSRPQAPRVLAQILVARELQTLGGHGEKPRLLSEIAGELTACFRFPEPAGRRLLRRLPWSWLLGEEVAEDTNEERALASHGDWTGPLNVICDECGARRRRRAPPGRWATSDFGHGRHWNDRHRARAGRREPCPRSGRRRLCPP